MPLPPQLRNGFNKGKPVRQYEPFFTDTHRFEFDVRIGVSPVLFYDPVERVVATLHPNHTWEKVVFDPWRQETWDVGDTVLAADPKNDPDVGNFFRRLSDADYLPTWHAQRRDGALGPEERDAARKAAIHADTPTVAHFDPLGRTFLTVAHNKFERSDTSPADPPTEEFYRTHALFDIEGNQREVIDARDRAVMRYDYDMLGSRIHQASMEAGERWTLNDVTGKPIHAWDSRGHEFRTAYDQLQRPTGSHLREGAGSERLVERTVYGETRPNPEAGNLRGKVVRLSDQAGVVTSDDYDFKGNLLCSRRQLAREYKTLLDWSAAVPLEAPTYTSRTSYDALNRPTELTAPDNSVIRPTYNEANLLNAVEANLRGAEVATPFVTDIDYDTRGQRTLIKYGNGARTTYEYDPLTFRLVGLLTRRDATVFPDDCPQPPPAGWPGCAVQNLHYTYDPVGNITHIRDDAQQTVYFRNRRIEPSAGYTYDAIHRLIEATGREHLGQTGGQPDPPTAPGAFNRFHTQLDHPGDGNAMGTYTERYLYDAVGNILAMQHRGSGPAHPGWTRAYTYNETSQLEAGKVNNRLSSTTVGGTTENYRYDGSAGLHGNITAMPHLPMMRWDYRDRLQATSRQVSNNGTPETTWYVYDAGGQRVRKVTERQAAPGQTPIRKAERIYVGGFEIYREHGGNGNTVELERETLHIMDDKQRIALVETRTQGNDPAPEQLTRYQLGNHLGSASLELDHQAQIISYEECYPYGSTSYQAVRSQIETPKRYRYTGKERDEESGLYYHGARYHVPWLGRWVSCDPIGILDTPNLYQYVANNPQNRIDPTGNQDTSPIWEVKGGVRFSVGTTSLEVKPFVQGTISSVLTDKVGIDAGIQFELYTANPKYGIERGALGGALATYLGPGLAFDSVPNDQLRTNSFDIRTFSGSGPSQHNLRLGYGVTVWEGYYVGENRGFDLPDGSTSRLFSRTGNAYIGGGRDSWSMNVVYGNDNMPLGNKLDANETAFANYQVRIGDFSAEFGFFNVTDQIKHGTEDQLDPKYARMEPDPAGNRLAAGDYWDKERRLATYLTEGPGVRLHTVYGAVSAGAFQLRLGAEGKVGHDLTQGAIHRWLGYHYFPHKQATEPYLELNIDASGVKERRLDHAP